MQRSTLDMKQMLSCDVSAVVFCPKAEGILVNIQTFEGAGSGTLTLR